MPAPLGDFAVPWSQRALHRAARLGDGWFSSGTPQFEEAVRLRCELLQLRAESERAADSFRLVFRIEGTDVATARRYEAAGFDEILIWTDQVWPPGASEAEKRERLFTAAEALGIGAGS